MFLPMSEYELQGFERATAKNKKYTAVLRHKKSGATRGMSFGDKRYEQYKDSTGVGVYSHMDHNDSHRRALYRQRHQNDMRRGHFSPGYFSLVYLW